MENVLDFKTDEVIFRENSETYCIYLVKTGAVILYLNYGEPNEHLLGVVSAGKIFGESGLTINGTNLYTAVAYGDTRVIKITRANFREYVSKSPDSVVGLIKSLTAINSLLKNNIDNLIEELYNPEDKAAAMEQLTKDIAKESIKGTYSGYFMDHYNF